jgi:hypothetical protein
MHRRPFARLLFAFVAAAALAPADHAAATAETIRFNITPGLTYAFDRGSTVDLALELSGGGQKMEAAQRAVESIRGTVEILAAENGRPTRARVSFDPASLTVTTFMGQEQRTPFALAGRTVVLSLAGTELRGLEPEDGAPPLPELDPAVRRAIADVVAADDAMLPKTPVDVGDSWTAEPRRPGDQIHPSLRYRVREFTERNGRRVAVLECRGTLVGTQPGVDLKGTVSGPTLLDLETGLMLEGTLTGSLTSSGVVDQGGVSVFIFGQGTIEQSARLTIPPVAGGSPNAAPAAEATEAAGMAPEIAAATADWAEFRHPLGSTFRHPADWRVQTMPEGLAVIPPDHRPDVESILGLTSPAGGQTDPRAAAVVQEMDAMVARFMPVLRRTGAPTAIRIAGGEGAVYEYRGRSPDRRAVRCSIFLRIVDDTAVGFAALGIEEQIARRVPTVRLMFQTIVLPAKAATPGRGTPGTAGDDPRLVGVFAGEAIAGGGDTPAVNTRLVYAMNSDGTVLYGARSSISASDRDASGNLVWTASGTTGANVERGRWSASRGTLTIAWDSGARSQFAYGFEPDGSLVLRDPRTRKLLNFYRRVN